MKVLHQKKQWSTREDLDRLYSNFYNKILILYSKIKYSFRLLNKSEFIPIRGNIQMNLFPLHMRNGITLLNSI